MFSDRHKEKQQKEATITTAQSGNSVMAQQSDLNLQPGVSYTWYADGSCDYVKGPVCLSEDQAKRMCGGVKGYTKGMIDKSVVTNDKASALFAAGIVGEFSAEWNGKNCMGHVSATGIYNGTSSISTIQGPIETFFYSDDREILADYIQGYAD